MYADRKYAYSKLQDIKIEGRRGAMTTGNERGDGLIGIIRPERNDDVIVTVGPSNRALPMRSNRDQIERKIEKERERMQIIQYEPPSHRGFTLILLNRTFVICYTYGLRTGNHINVLCTDTRPIALSNTNCFPNFCIKYTQLLADCCSVINWTNFCLNIS